MGRELEESSRFVCTTNHAHASRCPSRDIGVFLVARMFRPAIHDVENTSFAPNLRLLVQFLFHCGTYRHTCTTMVAWSFPFCRLRLFASANTCQLNGGARRNARVHSYLNLTGNKQVSIRQGLSC